MPLFKKRNKNKKPDINVYMPYKKPVVKTVRRKKKFGFKNHKSSKSNDRKKSPNISNIFLYIIVPLLCIALLYAATLFILNMRNSNDMEHYEEQYVIGIEGIPTYPNSEFIFTNSIDEPSVANFISSGNSAYRLPNDISITDAFQYYSEILPSKGWSFIFSVDVGSEEMKDGQYWFKDGDGLRIYSKFNDIWYELITVEQANTGLKERVAKEIERDLLLANQDLLDLLPDFPWVIKIPKEYIISYRVSSFENLRLVEFRKLGTEEKLTVTPIGNIGGNILDNLLREYVDILSKESEREWGISNTILTYTKYGRALRGSINSDGEVHDVAVIPNTYDNVLYVLDSNKVGDPFFDYVLSNLEPQSTAKD